MGLNLSQSDLAFRFYAPKTTKNLTFALGHKYVPSGVKAPISQKVEYVEPWKVFYCGPWVICTLETHVSILSSQNFGRLG